MSRLISTSILVLALCAMGCSDDDLPPILDGGGGEQIIVDQGADQPQVQPDGLETDGPQVVDCVGKSDGEVCGTDAICISELCVASRCGDGYVNDADGQEECEDGNEEAGDGCTFCMWDCSTNTDCDDGNLCNGQEGCTAATHVCTAGTPPAASTPCKKADGSDGVCSSEECVDAGCGNGTIDGDEDCDDQNDVANDGCETDCTFSCEADADCDDGDLCNGTETCDKTDAAKPVCKPGTAVTCTSTNAGCVGACDASTGACVFEDVDQDGSTCEVDCKDNDPAIFPGAPECADGKDNDCDPDTADGADGDCKCYVDRDGDGFAASGAASITAVTCPEGYTSVAPGPDSTDCWDRRVDVFPGQTLWFEKPYTTLLPNTSFDYNCKNGEEQQDSRLYRACLSMLTRCTGSGWSTTVPKCGDAGEYITCSVVLGTCRASRPAKRIQACH